MGTYEGSEPPARVSLAESHSALRENLPNTHSQAAQELLDGLSDACTEGTASARRTKVKKLAQKLLEAGQSAGAAAQYHVSTAEESAAAAARQAQLAAFEEKMQDRVIITKEEATELGKSASLPSTAAQRLLQRNEAELTAHQHTEGTTE